MFGYFRDKELEERIRKNLIEAISFSGLSQTAIARSARVSSATISSYIHKNKMPTLCTFVRICKALDVSADEILGLKD